MSITKIVHGYRSKRHHEVMVCSFSKSHARSNLIIMLKNYHLNYYKAKFDQDWEYFTMEVEFPDGSNLDGSNLHDGED